MGRAREAALVELALLRWASDVGGLAPAFRGCRSRWRLADAARAAGVLQRMHAVLKQLPSRVSAPPAGALAAILREVRAEAICAAEACVEFLRNFAAGAVLAVSAEAAAASGCCCAGGRAECAKQRAAGAAAGAAGAAAAAAAAALRRAAAAALALRPPADGAAGSFARPPLSPLFRADSASSAPSLAGDTFAADTPAIATPYAAEAAAEDASGARADNSAALPLSPPGAGPASQDDLLVMLSDNPDADADAAATAAGVAASAASASGVLGASHGPSPSPSSAPPDAAAAELVVTRFGSYRRGFSAAGPRRRGFRCCEEDARSSASPACMRRAAAAQAVDLLAQLLFRVIPDFLSAALEAEGPRDIRGPVVPGVARRLRRTRAHFVAAAAQFLAAATATAGCPPAEGAEILCGLPERFFLHSLPAVNAAGLELAHEAFRTAEVPLLVSLFRKPTFLRLYLGAASACMHEDRSEGGASAVNCIVQFCAVYDRLPAGSVKRGLRATFESGDRSSHLSRWRDYALRSGTGLPLEIFAATFMPPQAAFPLCLEAARQPITPPYNPLGVVD